MTREYLACDLGAESGRLIRGSLGDGKLRLEELHRFPNIPIKKEGHLYWNIPNLILELKEGLRKAAARQLNLTSISTDSWGVDYLLFGGAGELLEPTFHYRDSRTQGGVDSVFKALSWPELFSETGIQFMPLNTIFQLAAETPERLAAAESLLGVADGFNFFLCGARKIEVSMASTFQLYNPVRKGWSEKLIKTLGLPRRIFPEIVPSGTLLGRLRPTLAREAGLPEIPVVASCSHDTGAAVVGVPASGKNWAYISSGTWSLIGVEQTAPVISERCRELNFTNEIGYGGSVRLLKNIIGLWLVQECRRQWETEGRHLDYAELTRRAAGAKPFGALINPASREFLAPERMATQIALFCERTGQSIPNEEGALIRCALESLALLYARALKQLEELIGSKIEKLHVVGGGSRNELLNQFTADACGIPVVAGPAEATAVGNIMVQAIASGQISGLEEARAVIEGSSEIKLFDPRSPQLWREQSRRFEKLLENEDGK